MEEESLYYPCKNKHAFNITIILFAQCPRYLIERIVLMVLVFYYKGMLEKGTMQGTQQFLGFFFVIERIEKTQLNAAHAHRCSKN